jgi:hypothetical protein
MTESTDATFPCPRDGAAMEPGGRRSGVWRCPDCGGIFIDAGAAGGPAGVPSWLPPVVVSVALSLVATLVARRIARRGTE